MSDQNGSDQSGADRSGSGQGWTDRRDDWEDVSDNFSRLGRMLQDRFTGAGAAPGAEGEVRDAMRSLGEALNRWGEQLSAAAADPGLRDQAGRAARAFGTAVGNAFETAADELGSMMRGQRRPRPEEEPWLTSTDDIGREETAGTGAGPGESPEREPGAGEAGR